MRMFLLLLLVFSTLLAACTVLRLTDSYRTCKARSWIAYYPTQFPKDQAALEALRSFGLIVMNAEHKEYVKQVKSGHNKVLAYVSVGEVGPQHPWMPYLQAHGMLLQENPAWKGNYVVDLRQKQWRQYVIQRVIPPLLAAGFDGVMLDTIESPLHLELYGEASERERHRGMKAAAVELLKEVRAAFPGITIIMNRGFPVLGKAVPYVDGVIAESVFTDYDAQHQRYEMRPLEQRQLLLAQIQAYKRAAEKAGKEPQLFGLEYGDLADTPMVKKLYDKQRQQGWRPYVGSRALNVIALPPLLMDRGWPYCVPLKMAVKKDSDQ